MKKVFVMVAAISSMVALNSCSEQVMNETMSEGLNEGESLLRVMTRGETTPVEGKVYVFNSSGNFVRLLNTDEGGQLTSTNLVAGTYTVYAIGGDDLTAYSLPSEDDASAESVICLAEGKEMTDLFMTSDDITLTEGNTSNLELELERQVIKLKEVTIKQVPTNVTKVEVTISPLHEGIKLNGTLTEGNTSLSIELTKSSDNKTWTNGDNQPYYFPSDGSPTITVSFTNSSGVKSYSCQADDPFTANHQVVIEGTYSETQDAILGGTLTAKAWSANLSETFEFNEDNLVVPEAPEVPVAGGTYLGYYVVSVSPSTGSGTEEEHWTAVLLRKTQENGIGSAEEMAERASEINKPVGEGITCGEWRLPTVEECRIFLEDDNVNQKIYGANYYYYCLDGDKLKMMSAWKSSTGVITITGPRPSDNSAASYNDETYYRPVIDITY